MGSTSAERTNPFPSREPTADAAEQSGAVVKTVPEAMRRSALPSIEGIANPNALREAALSLDEARREHAVDAVADTERALLVWEGLLRGKVSLVDWFDSDGRRFVMLKINSLQRACGCGLTAREYQVAMGAALGESSKITGYRLGISPSRVSALLKGSMRKLGVRTKAQLVIMVRVLGGPSTQPLEAACPP